jgi:hypothetical protein
MLLQRGAVKVEARRTVKGASSAAGPASFWYGPGKCPWQSYHHMQMRDHAHRRAAS